MFRQVTLLVSLCFILCDGVCALDNKQLGNYVIVDRLVEAPFELSDALLFIDFHDGNVSRFYATVVPVESDNKKNSHWFVGTKVKLPADVNDLTLSVIMLGGTGEVLVAAPTAWQAPRDEKGALTPELLRAHLVEQEGVLKSWDVQIDAQKDSLRRLRADAEVIADVGKILDVREEIERSNIEIAAIDRDMLTLKTALQEVKKLPSPRNFSQREVQLTQQLAELAAVAKEAETNEFQRRTETEGDLQRKLEIIETTRFDDLESLERMYERLQERIKRLEAPT